MICRGEREGREGRGGGDIRVFSGRVDLFHRAVMREIVEIKSREEGLGEG